MKTLQKDAAGILMRANCTSVLLVSGIDFNSKNNSNTTALSSSTGADTSSKNNSNTTALSSSTGADTNSRNSASRTALPYVAGLGHEACVSLLLSKGTAIDVIIIDSYKPLATALTTDP